MTVQVPPRQKVESTSSFSKGKSFNWLDDVVHDSRKKRKLLNKVIKLKVNQKELIVYK